MAVLNRAGIAEDEGTQEAKNCAFNRILSEANMTSTRDLQAQGYYPSEMPFVVYWEWFIWDNPESNLPTRSGTFRRRMDATEWLVEQGMKQAKADALTRKLWRTINDGGEEDEPQSHSFTNPTKCPVMLTCMGEYLYD
ncbi:MAG: hypothetical protein SFZ02_12360 [bacterium]|nr:hypothetical protein [bacterium]